VPLIISVSRCLISALIVRSSGTALFLFFPLFSFFGLNLSSPLDCKTESSALSFLFSYRLQKLKKILARKVTRKKLKKKIDSIKHNRHIRA
jgi:hypothetical protein